MVGSELGADKHMESEQTDDKCIHGNDWQIATSKSKTKVVRTSAAAHRAPDATSQQRPFTRSETCHHIKPPKRPRQIKMMMREMRTGALGLGDDSLAQLTGREGGRRLDVVPLLLGERVDTAVRSKSKQARQKKTSKNNERGKSTRLAMQSTLATRPWLEAM